jgi:hypothetical protein
MKRPLSEPSAPLERAGGDVHFTVSVGPVLADGTIMLSLRFTNFDDARSFHDLAARGLFNPVRPSRTPDRPLPAGMTAWVSAEDVEYAVGCSRSKANEYLRAAAGRPVGTGRLLRVPVDVWEGCRCVARHRCRETEK